MVRVSSRTRRIDTRTGELVLDAIESVHIARPCIPGILDSLIRKEGISRSSF